MSNKEFIARNGLIVTGDANIANPTLIVAGQNVLASFTSANNYAGAMANSANAIASATFATITNAASAFGFANSVSTNTTAAFGFANGVSTNTTAAFAKANTALQNTTGTFEGTLTVTGNTVFSANAVLSNTNIVGIRTASFNAQATQTSTSGSLTIDWTVAQNWKQTEPTGTITYTFTAPTGPCHLQLIIDSDGTSTAQTINWPGTVIWLVQTFSGTNNKKSVINFWYDGTNYYAMGSTQV